MREPNWRPQGSITRFKHFALVGPPWWSSVSAIIAAGLGCYSVSGPLLDMVRGAHMDTGRFVFGLVALAVSAALVWFAVDRVLNDPDGYLELDPTGRQLLVVNRSGIPGAVAAPGKRSVTKLILPLSEIQGLISGTSKTTIQYVQRGTGEDLHRETRVRHRLIAMPSGIELFISRTTEKRDAVAEAISAAGGITTTAV